MLETIAIIKEGQELTISYGGLDEFQQQQGCRAYMKNTFFFECTCPVE